MTDDDALNAQVKHIQVLSHVRVVERDREVVGKLAYY